MKSKVIFKFILLIILCGSFSSTYAQRHKHQRAHRHAPNYRYSKLPRWGYTYNVAPKNATVVVHAGAKYHYHSGIFYKNIGAKYKIIKAPVGIRISTLPKDKIRIMVKGKKYFYYYGTYYIKDSESNVYITVAPPIGARIDALPDGYKELQKNGDTYYEFEGVLYKEVSLDTDDIWYEVIKVN